MTGNKVSIVVGGTGGIGSHIVLKLADAGSDIVLVYRSAEEKAAELKRKIEAAGRECMLVRADVSNHGEVQSFVSKVIERFGRIDALVNTQGWLHELHLFHEDTIENFQQTINTELWSVIYCCKAVIPQMIKQGSGRIVTVGSDSGKVGSLAEAVSSAARGGVIALSKSLARELARHKINVNTVCPGPTETGLFDRMLSTPGFTGKVMQSMTRAIPMRRLAHAEEVADVAVFLASGGSTYVTGQAISVSGGLTMS